MSSDLIVLTICHLQDLVLTAIVRTDQTRLLANDPQFSNDYAIQII